MPDYILLMRGDGSGPEENWPDYFARLKATGRFRGGSAIGAGVSRKQGEPARPLADEIIGYIRIEAADLEEAESALAGNPVFEAGGTVEIRLLPEDTK